MLLLDNSLSAWSVAWKQLKYQELDFHCLQIQF